MTNAPVEAIEVARAQPYPGAPDNWKRFFTFSTDHKVIGIQYIVTSFFFFLVGGLFSMVMRGELITPEADLIDRTVYNALFTMHGSVMLFLWTFPVLVGIGNYLVPLMIGARDMAFPRLNAVSFWLIPVVGVLMIGSFLAPGGPSQSGWWAYPPVSLQNPSGSLINGQVLWLLAVAISGVSSIMGGVNFVTTIFRMRAPGMGWFRMPAFVWSVLAAQLIQLYGLPSLTAGAVMLLLDITAGTSFFAPERGGNPVLYQHFFWFYSHPAVYVMVLPVFGIFSEVIPVHARKPLFGYRVIAVSSILITFISATVWVHHMFASATPSWMRILFMVTSMLVGVPTGIKIFGWVATLWGGKIRLTTPMLFAIAGFVNFVFAGITGIMLASVPIDIHVNNTYFVVGHFHYVIYGTIVYGIYAGLYHWFPKMTGRMYYEGLGKVHFALTLLGTNLTFWPMHPLGLMGMPRRVASYDPEFAFWNVIASLGGFLLGISVLPFILNMVSSWVQGEKAGDNPWRAIGLEWLTSSPPPVENFEEIPTVISGPYGYGKDEPLVATKGSVALGEA
ncbi:cytochrome c oxidase subunit I [Pseudanabaena sp. FACHB-2040]|uniref:cytochrome c oxidase subunit I n=1 Tax=Pseudanabaena sp. FACHB-2040 TaxID=2692859 RepID=UPI001687A456|nr:cytochrome c oxidase subunit I [Pseudanabaena sp. FACHB-2040]MBD2257964.1 cytochrome c oxidase subunit I [Pseudanabaena sp. FACHB-2040]